jgi:hypothetical protein
LGPPVTAVPVPVEVAVRLIGGAGGSFVELVGFFADQVREDGGGLDGAALE